MLSQDVEQFMARFQGEGLTFDDVSLCTRYADFLPHETSVKTMFSRNIPLNIPFVSAAMDTVTEAEMAIAMAMSGGLGVMHKNLDADRQAEEVARVKHYLNGLIDKPVTFPPDIRVVELLAERERRQIKFTGFPIVDANGCLCGIITARDLKFLGDQQTLVRDAMTTELVTAPVGTGLQKAFDLMVKHRVGKLPLVDRAGRLAGLYSFHDVNSLIGTDEPGVINRDKDYRLRVAAAISPDDFERVAKLLAAGVDAIVVDTAHGHSKGVLERSRRSNSRGSRRTWWPATSPPRRGPGPCWRRAPTPSRWASVPAPSAPPGWSAAWACPSSRPSTKAAWAWAGRSH